MRINEIITEAEDPKDPGLQRFDNQIKSIIASTVSNAQKQAEWFAWAKKNNWNPEELVRALADAAKDYRNQPQTKQEPAKPDYSKERALKQMDQSRIIPPTDPKKLLAWANQRPDTRQPFITFAKWMLSHPGLTLPEAYKIATNYDQYDVSLPGDTPDIQDRVFNAFERIHDAWGSAGREPWADPDEYDIEDYADDPGGWPANK